MGANVDLTKLATKEDLLPLNSRYTRLDIKVDKLDRKADELDRRLFKIEVSFSDFKQQAEDNKNIIVNKIDLLLSKFLREEESRLIQKGQLDENSEMILSHENRIKKLETARA